MGWCGSSPLTRGKLPKGAPAADAGGLIPAHAGKTPRRPPTGRYSGAHPRSRGENMKKADAEALKQGSSPLTRGKRFSFCVCVVSRGLIPAHAGKTPWWRDPWGEGAAHPRSRGENSYAATIAAMFAGSSPLTRGKHTCNGCNDPRRGLIPAHAGKTTERYPRQRG